MNAELFVFIIFAFAALAGAVTLISARNPVYSAMGLLLTMLSMAVFYVLLDAHFIAVVQVIIYAGAVMTLFLFVIMLIGVDKRESQDEAIPYLRPMVGVLGGGLIILLLVAGWGAWVTHDAGTGEVGTIEAISDALFGTWMLPFQATILLLTIAAIGSVALARYESPDRSPLRGVDPGQSPRLRGESTAGPQAGGRGATEVVDQPVDASAVEPTEPAEPGGDE